MFEEEMWRDRRLLAVCNKRCHGPTSSFLRPNVCRHGVTKLTLDPASNNSVNAVADVFVQRMCSGD